MRDLLCDLEIFPDQSMLYFFAFFVFMDLLFTYLIRKNIKHFANKYYNLNIYFGYVKSTVAKVVSIIVLLEILAQNIPYDIILAFPIAVYAFHVFVMIFDYFKYNKLKSDTE